METSIYDNDPVSDTFWVKPPAPSAWEASCQIKCEMRNVAQGGDSLGGSPGGIPGGDPLGGSPGGIVPSPEPGS